MDSIRTIVFVRGMGTASNILDHLGKCLRRLSRKQPLKASTEVVPFPIMPFHIGEDG